MNVNLRAVAAETLSIIERGSYQRPGGGDVQLAEQMPRPSPVPASPPWNRQQLVQCLGFNRRFALFGHAVPADLLQDLSSCGGPHEWPGTSADRS